MSLLFFALLLVTFQTVTQDLRVTARTDRARLRIGENLVYTLIISGAGSAIPQPALPPLRGFKGVGQYVTPEVTASGSALAYHYLLTPTEAGRLEVPDFSIRIAGRTFTVPGFTAEVETSPGARAAPGGRPGAPPAEPAVPAGGTDLILAGSLSTPKVYQGQPVIYTLHLLTRRSVRGLDIVRTPDFSGFQKVEDPDSTKGPTRQTTRDGRVYLDVVVKRVALFPLRAGQLEVTPFTAELRLEPSGIGGPARVSVSGGAAALEVVPLPPSPAGFKGAVGTFQLAADAPPPSRADMGQPFLLALRIEGAGFLPEDPLDTQASPFFSPYPVTVEDSSGFSGGAYKTRRTIRLPMLPKMTGDAILPPVRLVFFDPALKSYKTLEAGGGKILVTGAAAASQTDVSLAPLVRDPRPGPQPIDPMAPGLFWALLALPFALNGLLAAGLALYGAFFMAPEKTRARSLARQARRGLGQARRNLDVRKADAFHEALSRAMTASLDLIAGRATGGLSRDQLAEALAETGMQRERIGGILDLRDGLETARYAPERPTRQDLQERFEAVAKLCKEGDHA